MFDHSHFYLKWDMVVLEIVVERPTGRMLEVQDTSRNENSLSLRQVNAATLIKRPLICFTVLQPAPRAAGPAQGHNRAQRGRSRTNRPTT